MMSKYFTLYTQMRGSLPARTLPNNIDSYCFAEGEIILLILFKQ